MVFYYLRNTVKNGPKTPKNIQSRKRSNTFFSLVTTRVISSVIHAKYQENVLSFSRYCIAATPLPSLWRASPFVKGRGAGFLNITKSRGNWNFSKSRGEKKRGERSFRNFHWSKIAGDETSNRKQNFRIMFSWVI